MSANEGLSDRSLGLTQRASLHRWPPARQDSWSKVFAPQLCRCSLPPGMRGQVLSWELGAYPQDKIGELGSREERGKKGSVRE